MQKESWPTLSVSAYLKRIGFTGPANPDVETLNRLQELHVMAVPYENLEIMQQKPVTLDIPSLYDKIVNRRRGGYCFELNGLYAWLLSEIGFEVIQHFGRWIAGEPLRYPERRHRIIRVLLAGKAYICDVGVGMPAPRRPLLLAPFVEQEQYGAVYRIVPDEIDIYDVQVKKDGNWETLYSFNDDPCISVDYMQAHYYCTHFPQSRFINETIICIKTPEGHNSIADVYDPETMGKVREFRVHTKDGVEAELLRSEKRFFEVLQQYFGIDAQG